MTTFDWNPYVEQALSLVRPQIKTAVQQHEQLKGSWSVNESLWKHLATHLFTDKATGIFVPKDNWGEPANIETLPHLNIRYPSTLSGSLSFHKCDKKDLILDRNLNVYNAPLQSAPADVNIVMLPALAVDRQGRRIGRGGGFYDQFIAQHPNLPTVAVVRSDYLLDEIPELWLHKNDRLVDAILTEDEFVDVSFSQKIKGIQPC